MCSSINKYPQDNPNLKKRRPFAGHEDVSAIHLAQTSSASIDPPNTNTSSSLASSSHPHSIPTPTVAPSYRPDHFSPSECQALHQAASVLQCPLSLLLELNHSSRLYPNPPSSPHHTSQKRPRLCTDMSVLPSHEKAMPRSASARATEEFTRESPPSTAFSFNVDGSRLATCFTSFCSPCTTTDPPGRRLYIWA